MTRITISGPAEKLTAWLRAAAAQIEREHALPAYGFASSTETIEDNNADRAPIEVTFTTDGVESGDEGLLIEVE